VPVPVPAAVGTRTVQCHMFFGRLLAPAQRRHCSSRKRSSTWKCNRTSPRRQSSASRSPRRVSSRIQVFILVRGMGAAFLVGLRGHQAVEVDHRAITMVARTSARLKVYRGELDPGVVLAWEIRQPAARQEA
jgi:hypothetical protein